MATTLTTELSLIKPTPGTHEPYTVANMNANSNTVDALFNFTTGHDHSAAHKGKPIPTAGIASGVTITSPTITGAIFDATSKIPVQLYDSGSLGSAQANIDITSISAAYTALLVWLYARGDNASTTVNAIMRFNNDSAGNYDYQTFFGSAATSSAAETFATGSALIGAFPGASAGANLFGSSQALVPFYAGTVNNKVWNADWASKIGTATGNLQIGKVGGFWRSNAAISRVTLVPSAGNFAAGSRAVLFGLP